MKNILKKYLTLYSFSRKFYMDYGKQYLIIWFLTEKMGHKWVVSRSLFVLLLAGALPSEKGKTVTLTG